MEGVVQAKQTLELLLPEGDYAAALDVMDDLRVSHLLPYHIVLNVLGAQQAALAEEGLTPLLSERHCMYIACI